MGYVPTGGSGGASIGGSVSGATAGSVFFAGAAGVMAQDNAGFFYDNANNQLKLTASAATQTPLQINLASAQSADAFQVKNSGGTTIAYIDANGYYNGQNGLTTRIQNTSIATVGMLLDAGNTRIGAYEGTNYWSLLTSTEIRQKSGSQFSWSSDGTSAVSASADTGLARSAVGIVKITNGSTGAGALHLQEQTAPSAPATNNVYLYAEDNGAGKTRIVALFPTGAAQVLATEP